MSCWGASTFFVPVSCTWVNLETYEVSSSEDSPFVNVFSIGCYIIEKEDAVCVIPFFGSLIFLWSRLFLNDFFSKKVHSCREHASLPLLASAPANINSDLAETSARWHTHTSLAGWRGPAEASSARGTVARSGTWCSGTAGLGWSWTGSCRSDRTGCFQ